MALISELITGFPSLSTAELLTLVNTHAERSLLRHGRTPRYLSLAFCNVLTVRAFPQVQAALASKGWIDEDACGHACHNWHVILDLETRQYVTESAVDLFTRLYPPVLDLESRDASLVRRVPRSRRRWLLIPGLGECGPSISFAPHGQTWTFEFHAGNYRWYMAWDHRVDESGIEGLMRWMFYEIAHTLPPRQGRAMHLVNGHLWGKCPVAFARPLVGSLHAFLVPLTRQCERAKVRAAYYEQHPELPRFCRISARELFALSPAQLDHDWWCALRAKEGGATCTCTWAVEHDPLGVEVSPYDR
jgi:hypothetical protein